MELLSKFYKHFSKEIQSMQETDHNFSDSSLNSYHAEGSIWTHTMMVYSHCPNIKVVKMAALLHDVGKPVCAFRNYKSSRVSFVGHEGVSFFMASKILDHVCWNLSPHEKIEILTLIANHSDFYSWKNKPKDFGARYESKRETFEHLKLLAIADVRGRVSDKEMSTDFIEKQRFDVCDPFAGASTPKLTLLVGLPGSGKSTYAEQLDCTIISRDSLMLEMANTSDYSKAWNVVDHKSVDKELMVRFHNSMRTSSDVVIDMTNMSLKSRRRWLACAKRRTTHAVVFPASIDTCMSRCTKKIDKDVYLKMAKSFTLPMTDEFDTTEFISC